MKKLLGLALVAGLTLVVSAPVFAQDSDLSAHQTVRAADLQFADIQPEGFDPGMKVATLVGDPSAPDEPYVIRLSFIDGYRFPPHYHPQAENLTVLSGTFLLAMGVEADETQLKSYGPGDVLYIPAEHPHFGGATGETVIQLHGVGPFDIYLVNKETAAQAE